jgi:nucleotide-binding universal stress UspA family protein
MSQRKIIVGVDDSVGSHRAVRWAAEEAVRNGYELIVICAYDWHVPGSRFQTGAGYADNLRAVADAAVKQAVAAASAHSPGVDVRGETVLGPAGPVLVQCGPGDLVVVGNRGRGGFASLVLGSVGHHVVSHSTGTAVVVRGRPDATTGPVVVGVDSRRGDAALRQAFDEAGSRDDALIVVHAYRPLEVPTAYGLYAVEDASERQAEELAALRDTVDVWATKYPHVPVEISAIEGHPTEVLTGLSRRAQLVVVGHRTHGLGHIALGPVAAQLLHHAECPVMIVRSSDGSDHDGPQ